MPGLLIYYAVFFNVAGLNLNRSVAAASAAVTVVRAAATAASAAVIAVAGNKKYKEYENNNPQSFVVKKVAKAVHWNSS